MYCSTFASGEANLNHFLHCLYTLEIAIDINHHKIWFHKLMTMSNGSEGEIIQSNTHHPSNLSNGWGVISTASRK